MIICPAPRMLLHLQQDEQKTNSVKQNLHPACSNVKCLPWHDFSYCPASVKSKSQLH